MDERLVGKVSSGAVKASQDPGKAAAAVVQEEAAAASSSWAVRVASSCLLEDESVGEEGVDQALAASFLPLVVRHTGLVAAAAVAH